jgi:SNF2 family DNA or RNA helicase
MHSVRIDHDGAHIWLSETTPADAPKCRQVAGARYGAQVGGERDQWRFPLDMATCRGLRREFGDRLRVSSRLGAWAREAIAREQDALALKSAAVAELVQVPKLAPEIAEAMANRPYQTIGAAFPGVAGNCLIADQPGLGKTIQTLAALVEASPEGGLHLVFCPLLAVTLVWVPEVAQWLPELGTVIALSGNRAKREAALASVTSPKRGEHIFVVANIEMARIKVLEGPQSRPVTKVAEYPDLFARTWDTIVVDESHRALIRTSGKPTQVRLGMMTLKARRKIALSGTPMRGKPQQLWGTLNWLRPDTYTGYWRWVERYFKLTSNGYSNYILNGFREGGEDDLARDLHTVMLRRTKEELGLKQKQYPGTHIDPADPDSPFGIWLPLSREQKRLNKQLLADGVIRGAEDDGEDENIVNGHLAVATRQKQIAGSAVKVVGGEIVPCLPSPKFDWILEKLAELGITEADEVASNDYQARIVIASQFTKLLNLFARELRALGIACHMITGETPERKRFEAMTDFQSESPSARVFLINTKAAGVAITLDMADDLVLLDETYVPDDQEQVEDRIDRTGRRHVVNIHYLRSLDSVEEEIAWVTAARESVTSYLLDRSRGVEAAKMLYKQHTGR